MKRLLLSSLMLMFVALATLASAFALQPINVSLWTDFTGCALNDAPGHQAPVQGTVGSGSGAISFSNTVKPSGLSCSLDMSANVPGNGADGINKFVEWANSSYTQIGNAGENYSIIVWYNSSDSTYQGIYGSYNGGNYIWGLKGWGPSGTFNVLDGSTNLVDSVGIDDGLWHMLVVTRDASTSTLNIYRDGVYATSIADAAPDVRTFAPITLGYSTQAAYATSGYIAQFAVIKDALTNDTVSCLYNNGSGKTYAQAANDCISVPPVPVVYSAHTYFLENNSDENGTLNFTGSPTSFSTGINGNGAYFDGTDTHVYTTKMLNDIEMSSKNWTLSGWVNFTDLNMVNYNFPFWLIANDEVNLGTEQYVAGIYWEAGFPELRLQVDGWNSCTGQYLSLPTPLNGVWTHYSIVHNVSGGNNDMLLYIDGSYFGTLALGSAGNGCTNTIESPTVSGPGLHLGSVDTFEMNGTVDQVYFMPVALDATQVYNLYLLDAPPPPPMPIANFTMNQSSGVAPLTVQFNDTSTYTPGSFVTIYPQQTTNDSTIDGIGIRSTGVNANYFLGVNITANNDLTIDSVLVYGGGNGGIENMTIIDSSTQAILFSATFPTTNTYENVTVGINITKGQAFLVVVTSTSTFSTYIPTYGLHEAPVYYSDVNITAEVGGYLGSVVNTGNPYITDLATITTTARTTAPAQWFWDFGDGSNSTIQSPTHVFNGSPGNYSVNMTITDLYGNDSIVKSVEILALVVPLPPHTYFFRNNVVDANGTLNLIGSPNSFGAGPNPSEPNYPLSAAQFDGTATSLYAPGIFNGSQISQTNWSIAVWANMTDLSGYYGDVFFIEAEDAAANSEYQVGLYYEFGTNELRVTTNGWGSCLGASYNFPVPAVNAWNHYSIVHTYVDNSTSNLLLYLNGELYSNNSLGQVQASACTNSGNKRMTVGSLPSLYMKGSVDDLYVRDTALSAQEVYDIYALNAPPKANFRADHKVITQGIPVHFTDLSTLSPTSWAWDFQNDGLVDSTVQNPEFAYSSPGNYTVNLTVSNANGADEEVKVAYIEVFSPSSTSLISDYTHSYTFNGTYLDSTGTANFSAPLFVGFYTGHFNESLGGTVGGATQYTTDSIVANSLDSWSTSFWFNAKNASIGYTEDLFAYGRVVDARFVNIGLNGGVVTVNTCVSNVLCLPGTGTTNISANGTENMWHHIVYAEDRVNNRALLWLDGTLEVNVTSPAGAGNTFANDCLGVGVQSVTGGPCLFYSGYFLSDNIHYDDLLLYTKNVSFGQAEVDQLFHTNQELPTAAPVANFTTINVTTGFAPLTVQFNDTSRNHPTSWAWDFDNDGIVDNTTQNPIYTYLATGNYTVNLTVTNALGSDEEVKVGYVYVVAPFVSIGSGTCSASPVYPNELDAPLATVNVSFVVNSVPIGNLTSTSFANNSGTCLYTTINATARSYSCEYPVHYYLSAGSYSAQVTYNNAPGNLTSTVNVTSCSVGTLLAYQQVQVTTIAFPGAAPGVNNVIGANPVTIQNTGNAPLYVRMTGYDLTGRTIPSNKLLSSSFKSGSALNASYSLPNSVSTYIGMLLQPGVNVTTQAYLWLSMPSNQFPQDYYSATPWVLSGAVSP